MQYLLYAIGGGIFVKPILGISRRFQKYILFLVRVHFQFSKSKNFDNLVLMNKFKFNILTFEAYFLNSFSRAMILTIREIFYKNFIKIVAVWILMDLIDENLYYILVAKLFLKISCVLHRL